MVSDCTLGHFIFRWDQSLKLLVWDQKFWRLHFSNKRILLSMLDFHRVSLKHDGTDGTDGPVKLVNTDGTAIERADGTANTGANYQIITY